MRTRLQHGAILAASIWAALAPCPTLAFNGSSGQESEPGLVESRGTTAENANPPGTELEVSPIQEPGALPEIPPGYIIVEGDMVVPQDWDTRATYDLNLWPGGDVPYEFDTNVTTPNQGVAVAAMAIWEGLANVNFRPRSGETYFIHIQAATVSNSPVGRHLFAHAVNISNWVQGTIVHELGHTLGFWHEQSRPDRDDFVTINTSNIQAGQGHNFNIHGIEYGPYDFQSIMHYWECAFSACANCPTDSSCSDGGRTISMLPDYLPWGPLIGTYNQPSCMDGLTMSLLYPEADWRFFNPANVLGSPFSGSFLDPYIHLPTAIEETPECGALWISEPGVYCAPGILDKGMIIRAGYGSVVLRHD